MKTILKQYSNTRQRQDIVPVRNLKARKIRSLRCRSALSQLSLRLRSASIAPAISPLSLHCNSYCCSAVAPISLSCRPAVAPLSVRYQSAVSLLLLCCCSTVTTSVTALLPLLLLGLFMVFASRVRIRVTVAIGDCQAHVSTCQ